MAPRPYTIGSAGGAVPFRFDGVTHEYIDLSTGTVLPHVTGMLEATGWVDTTWLTEEGRRRGTAVHRLTADYDLDVIETPRAITSGYKPYLLAHVQAVTILQVEMLAVEEPIVHPRFGYGCRPDRLFSLAGLKGVWEVKSGDPEKSHAIQTALQAMAAEAELHVPAELLARFCCYLKGSGKFKVERHTRRADFDEARRIVRTCCGV